MTTSPSRLRRIDCQSHIFAPEVMRIMEARTESPFMCQSDGRQYLVVGKWHRLMVSDATDLDAKVADMDAQGIDLAALSNNDPDPDQFGDDGPRVAKMIHDYLFTASERYPGRFFLLASLPLLQMEAALDELDRCVEQLGMKGVLLYSNLAGSFPDEPQFLPLFERLVFDRRSDASIDRPPLTLRHIKLPTCNSRFLHLTSTISHQTSHIKKRGSPQSHDWSSRLA